ncbi:MAG TPA: M56 family metallopeptidase [Longimicrobium sp.]|nr:M56 family metallopeptidase [Longimicrobium sp.]
MIAQWMLYCAAVGTLLVAGALAAERALRGFGRPIRWAWVTAIVLTLAIPAAARWLPRALPEPVPVPAVVAAAVDAGDAGAPETPPELPSATGGAPRGISVAVAALERPLALLWTGSTAAAVLALLAAWAVLQRRRRTWRAAEVDGVPVLLSPRTGPAVVGLFRSRIVLPEWVVRDAPPEVRALLLEHEREHLRAGDPRLLALGLAAVALMPWNPAVWWQLRRLRLAVEVDCDARVLARRADVRTYAALLLDVGRRASGAGRLITTTAFLQPPSFLERRIRMMTSSRARAPRLRAAGFGAAALVLAVAACRTPGPVQPPPEAEQTQVRTSAAPRPPVRAPEELAAVRAHYPGVFRAASTDTTGLLFVVAPGGEIERHARLSPAQVRVLNGGFSQRSLRLLGLSDREADESALRHSAYGRGVIGPGEVHVLWVQRRSPQELAAATAARRERLRTLQMQAELVRGYLARYMPAVAERGTPADFVWFAVDEYSRVLQHGDSRDTRRLRDLQSRPGTRVTRLALALEGGRSVSVALLQLNGGDTDRGEESS